MPHHEPHRKTRTEKDKLPPGDYGNIGVTGEVIKIENFNHMPGYNCQFSSLRKVLAYHGWDYSEEMVLGLAAALGMIYWETKFMPVPFIGALNAKDLEVFERCVKRLGGRTECYQTTSPAKGHERLKESLRAGNPAITFLDMAFLPYFFRDGAKIPYDAAHFGGHTVVVYGLDEAKGIVYVSDRFAHPIEVQLEYFQMARASLYQPFPPLHRIPELRLPAKAKPLKDVILGAIKEDRDFMMNPPISNFGLKGFLKFKTMFPTWYRRFDPSKFLLSLFNTFIYMETGGSGGAWVRCMYSRFLREAAEVLSQPAFDRAANTFDMEVNAIRELELAMLPDEFPNMAEIRKILIESNEVQERMSSDYQQKLRSLDDRLKKAVAFAIRDDYLSYSARIPKVQAAIQLVYELESKAWEQIESVTF
jgi:hypothetical protein